MRSMTEEVLSHSIRCASEDVVEDVEIHDQPVVGTRRETPLHDVAVVGHSNRNAKLEFDFGWL